MAALGNYFNFQNPAAVMATMFWLFTMHVVYINTTLYLYYLNYSLQKPRKDEKTEASIGHCKRASQKFPGKEEPQLSQN